MYVPMNQAKTIVPLERIEKVIFLIRGQRVILDSHLAVLYGVETKALKRAVRRNLERFPSDFLLELTTPEYKALRRQFGPLEKGKHAKFLPYAFTEQGVAMLSSVLRSQRAIRVNVANMRAFVRLRETLVAHRELAVKLRKLERKIESHDEGIRTLFEAIRRLMSPAPLPRRRIGFRP